MSSISSFDIIRFVVLLCPDPKIFSCIPASAPNAATVNPKGIKTLLDNGLITIFISYNPIFGNGPRSQSRNPSDCIILDIWVFDSLISVDKIIWKGFMKICNLPFS